MNQFTQAIENVCDKRHARMMQNGMSEAEAAKHIVGYLDGLLVSWKKSTNVIEFIKALRSGYSVELA